jgi:hypothetical protein
MSPSGPKADRLLCAIEMLKRSFASTQSRGRYRPKSVIARLLSHSRKQTFTVLPHRQNCAHYGWSRPARWFSKADAMSGVAFGCHGGGTRSFLRGSCTLPARLKDADPDENGGHGDNVDRHRLAGRR